MPGARAGQRHARHAARARASSPSSSSSTSPAPTSCSGSGHPAPEQGDLPAVLGLIRSDDAGRTWESVSELGRADFHMIDGDGEPRRGRPVRDPAGARERRRRRGRGRRARRPSRWSTSRSPPPTRRAGSRTTANGIFLSVDEGGTWRAIDPKANVRLAWPEEDALYRIDPGGPVLVSADGGETWEERGSTGGEPRELTAGERRRALRRPARRDRLAVAPTAGRHGRSWSRRERGAPRRGAPCITSRAPTARPAR